MLSALWTKSGLSGYTAIFIVKFATWHHPLYTKCCNTVFALIYGTAKNNCIGNRSALIRMR